ncbi:uncharacterized protein PHALS_10228 [Plasmopara halstedii]|uniref:Uncharacterized protein n=1 Tax=Plasmopara halstedii TaxID=4781 RepID=A0A0P1AGG8_PLAHL|nr:uncharacterized protein PHALS_10228 [Plasmopara halstedii]CEG40005.1 hypothetical protein PHALS_10228 [Plasmopara halstedii]|eukprot:XP_024576374.1 hypothetical protein PHALS_10228 [Plasmopara halstedii]
MSKGAGAVGYQEYQKTPRIVSRVPGVSKDPTHTQGGSAAYRVYTSKEWDVINTQNATNINTLRDK